MLFRSNYITRVVGNTAAEKAGLQPFDYVFGIDEYRTKADYSLTAILRKYEPGDAVTVHFYRKGKKQERKIELGKRSDAQYNKRSKKEDPFLGVEQSHKDKGMDVKGVRVNVVDNSTASSSGLEDGDIITHINDFPILDWQDMSAAIDMMNVGDNMKIAYIRGDRKDIASGPVKSLAETKYNSSSYHYDEYEDGDTDNFNFNFNEKGGDRDRGKQYGIETRIVEGISVNMEDMPTEEFARMKEKYGLDMPVVNNLAIEKLNLFPNPTMGMFELAFDLPNKGRTSINIYNSDGRNIYNYDLGSFSGDFQDKIDISQNGTGTYFLQITQDNKSLVQKVILSR